jgi:hypothetical protein
MSEGEESRRVRKTGSPKEVKAERSKAKGELKPEAERPKPKEHSAFDTPHSELSKSEIEHSKSEIKEPPTAKPQPPIMEVHHHPDLHHEKKVWKEYLLEGLMIFLAVTLGFFAEQIRERHVERQRLDNYFGSMELDIRSNIAALDSATREDAKMVSKYDTMVKTFLNNSNVIDRAAFARHMGAIWYRGFINRNETFEQMKSSGSIRYIDDFKLLTAIMLYVRATNFAQFRTERFELKYYTDLFLPTIYKSYDLPCKFYLDSAYTNNHKFIATLNNHVDMLKGKDADNFRQDVGGALMLRLERLRVSIAAYKIAKANCVSLLKLLKEYTD